MVTEVPKGSRLHVSVCYAWAQGAWLRELDLPAGVTVAQAVAASGFQVVFPDIDPMQHGLAVYGQAVAPEWVLRDGDRVEILRALVFDPKVSRRRRAEHRRLSAKGFAQASLAARCVGQGDDL